MVDIIGLAAAESQWVGWCKHTACQVTILYEFRMGVYTLAHSSQTELVRFYATIMYRWEEGRLDNQGINDSPHERFLSPNQGLLPN